jgi:hypothetical protein
MLGVYVGVFESKWSNLHKHTLDSLVYSFSKHIHLFFMKYLYVCEIGPEVSIFVSF